MEWLDWEEEPRNSWAEYAVQMRVASKPEDEIIITIWAIGLEEALDCGQVLSAIYL